MSREPRIFYKVVVVAGYTGKTPLYKSVVPAIFNKEPTFMHECTYDTENTWLTAPNNTRFFLFEHIRDAEQFSDMMVMGKGHCKIIQVHAKGVAYGCHGIASSESDHRINFWNMANKLVKRKSWAYACTQSCNILGYARACWDSVFARQIKILPNQLY